MRNYREHNKLLTYCIYSCATQYGVVIFQKPNLHSFLNLWSVYLKRSLPSRRFHNVVLAIERRALPTLWIRKKRAILILQDSLFKKFYATLAYIRHFIFAGCYDNNPCYLVTNLAGHLDFAGHLDLAGFYFSKCLLIVNAPLNLLQDRIFILTWRKPKF